MSFHSPLKANLEKILYSSGIQQKKMFYEIEGRISADTMLALPHTKYHVDSSVKNLIEFDGRILEG